MKMSRKLWYRLIFCLIDQIYKLLSPLHFLELQPIKLKASFLYYKRRFKNSFSPPTTRETQSGFYATKWANGYRKTRILFIRVFNYLNFKKRNQYFINIYNSRVAPDLTFCASIKLYNYDMFT